MAELQAQVAELQGLVATLQTDVSVNETNISSEHVLPVTIDLMRVHGHTVSEKLDDKTDLGELIQDAVSVVFSRQGEVRTLDLEHFEDTDLFETIPHAPF